MRRDSLKSILRLRQMVVDEAAQELADALRKETEAGQAVRAIEAAIARETERAEDLDGEDTQVEAFGLWLRRARQERGIALDAYDRTQADTGRARAVLSAARVGLEAAKTLQVKRVAEGRQAQLVLEQKLIDEAAARRR